MRKKMLKVKVAGKSVAQIAKDGACCLSSQAPSR